MDGKKVDYAAIDEGTDFHENYDPNKTVGEFKKAIEDPEPVWVSALDEINDAYEAFITLRDSIRASAVDNPYYKQLSKREQVLHAKAKQRRAKRKHGGKK